MVDAEQDAQKKGVQMKKIYTYGEQEYVLLKVNKSQ